MSEVEKDISRVERLIVRKLDGELSEDEELQLNRELIRDPEARQLLEEYQRIDGVAAEALSRVLADESLLVDAEALSGQSRTAPAQAYNRGRWLVPGAVAAALLALVLARFTPPSSPDSLDIARRGPPPRRMFPEVRPDQGREGLNQLANFEPGGRRVKRDTGREVIGVMGDDGNIYWIEIDRIRTFKQPRQGYRAPISYEEL
jgi:hypothetical protein